MTSWTRDINTGEIYIAGWKVAEVLGYKKTYSATSLPELKDHVKAFEVFGTGGNRMVNYIEAYTVMEYFKTITKQNIEFEKRVKDLQTYLGVIDNTVKLVTLEVELSLKQNLINDQVRTIASLEKRLSDLKIRRENLVNNLHDRNNKIINLEVKLQEKDLKINNFLSASICKRIKIAFRGML